MLSDADAARLATAFDLGAPRSLHGPVARGVIGQVWRLETERGAWAVKEWFEPPDMEELAEGVAFQDAAMAAGVPAPPVVRTSMVTGRSRSTEHRSGSRRGSTCASGIPGSSRRPSVA